MRTFGLLWLASCWVAFASGTGVEGQELAAMEKEDRLILMQGEEKIGEFVFADAKVKRPFFSNMRAPGGLQVTRNFPPIEGTDAMDHADMHPGIWLAFGDINGEDFWRNKATIRHDAFTQKPALEDEPGITGKALKFATTSTMLTKDGATLGRMESNFMIGLSDKVRVVMWVARFHATEGDLVFGDQEEMGFGVRVATPIAEKNGGVITSSQGVTGAKQTWGQPADWCDYSGTIDGQKAGITIMSKPRSTQPWWHNRDYGVFVANAFGRKAMKQGEKQSVTVKKGESLELAYAAMLHAGESPLTQKVEATSKK